MVNPCHEWALWLTACVAGEVEFESATTRAGKGRSRGVRTGFLGAAVDKAHNPSASGARSLLTFVSGGCQVDLTEDRARCEEE
jgi:hypothetical protein